MTTTVTQGAVVNKLKRDMNDSLSTTVSPGSTFTEHGQVCVRKTYELTLYSSYAGLVMCLIILFTGGFRVFTKGNWDANSFVSSYLDIPLVIVFFFGWKLIKKTRWVRLDELPLRAIIEQAKERAHQAEMEQQAEDALKGDRHRWLKYISWIWD